MREIRYRFWDEKNNRYIEWEEISCWNDYDKSYLFEMIIGEEKGIIPYQFTGLKDKNCKEIYEGDIVLVPYNYIGSKVVKWDECGRWNVSGYNIEKCRVIGNIHENPELLEK